jgi:hypothetical protein
LISIAPILDFLIKKYVRVCGKLIAHYVKIVRERLTERLFLKLLKSVGSDIIVIKPVPFLGLRLGLGIASDYGVIVPALRCP